MNTIWFEEFQKKHPNENKIYALAKLRQKKNENKIRLWKKKTSNWEKHIYDSNIYVYDCKNMKHSNVTKNMYNCKIWTSEAKKIYDWKKYKTSDWTKTDFMIIPI